MKKKIVAILMCGALAAGTIGCGSSEETVVEEPIIEEELVEEPVVEESSADDDILAALDQYISDGYEYPARWDFADELEFEGYSEEDAEAAIEAYDYDWNALAIANLEVQIEDGANSPREITNYMDLDGFTEDEIEYALENADIDWNDLAVTDANFWLGTDSGRDRDNIIQNLLLDGYTQEQAEYGADHVG